MCLLRKRVNKLVAWMPGMTFDMPVEDGRIKSGFDETMDVA